MLTTFYSYKGGVGRTFIAIEVAAQLAARGKSVLFWDLDLEAPGLSEHPALAPLLIPTAGGTLDLFENWQGTGTLTANQVRPSLRSVEVPPHESARRPGRLQLLFPLASDAAPNSYVQRLKTSGIIESLSSPNDANAVGFLDEMSSLFTDDMGFDHVIIDSRTGLTDLSALCTIALPDIVVLVAGLSGQNLSGLRQVADAVGQFEQDGQKKIGLRVVLNKVPKRLTKLQTKALNARKAEHLKGLTTSPYEFALYPGRFADDAIPSLVPLGSRETDVLEQIEEITRLVDDLDDARTMRTYKDANLRDRGIDRSDPEASRRGEDALLRGKRFEEEVADIFRLGGAEVVIQDLEIQDRQFDLLVVESTTSGDVTTLIECKNEATLTSVEQVEKFGRKRKTYEKLKGQRTNAVLVSKRGFQNTAHEIAKGYFVELMTYDQLTLRLFDRTSLIRAGIDQFVGTDLDRTYVEQELAELADLRKGDQTSLPALQTVTDWADNAGTRCVLVLGDMGMGKTSFTKRFAARLAERAKEDPTAPVPLLIDLRVMGSSAVTLENMLLSAATQLTSKRVTASGLLHAIRAGLLVPIFDGLDEMLAYADPNRYIDNMRQLLRATQQGGSMVMTCRTSFFTSRPQEILLTAKAQRESTIDGDTPLYDELVRQAGVRISYLQPFSDSQVNEFVDKKLVDEGDRASLIEALGEYGELDDLKRQPLMLNLMTQVIPKFRRQRPHELLSMVSLYETFIGEWISNDGARHKLINGVQFEVGEYLAWLLWQEPGNQMHHDTLVRLVGDWFESSGHARGAFGRGEQQQLDAEIRTATFLVRDESGVYRFLHRSFMEYLLARSVRTASQARTFDGLSAVLTGRRYSREVVNFVTGMSADSQAKTLHGVREVIANGERGEGALNGYLLSAALGKPITDLKLDFANTDLAGIDLTGADLRSADFSGANLDAALLIRADVSGVSFASASMVEAQLVDSYALGADFSGTNLTSADLSRSIFDGAQFSESNCTLTNFFGANLTGSTGPELKQTFGGVFLETVGRKWNVHESAATSQEDAQLFQQVGHTGWLRGCAFHQDGTILATTGGDRTIRLWNPSTGQHLHSLQGHSDSVTGCAFNHDGTILATSSADHTTRLWNPTSGEHLSTLEGHTDWVTGSAFNHDSTILATASADHTIRLWDPANGQHRTLQGHTGAVTRCAFNHDSTILATTSDDSTIRLWNPASGKHLSTLQGHTGKVTGCAFNHDGNILATTSDDSTIRLWSPTSGEHLSTLEGHTDWVTGCAFNHDGTVLATTSADHTIRLWNPANGHHRTLEGHTTWVTGCAFNHDGTIVATTSGDSTIRLWSPTSGEHIKTLQDHAGWMTGCAFNHDDTILATTSHDSTIRLWNPAIGQHLKTLHGHTGKVTGCAFNHDGTILATTSVDSTIRLWNPTSGEHIKTLEGHTKSMAGCAFNHDGTILATASADHTTRLWNPTSGEHLSTLQGHTDWVTGCAFNHDSTILATASADHTIRLWDPANGQHRTLQGHTGAVTRCAFNHDGNILATTSDDGTIRLWNPASGKHLSTLQGHTDWVTGCAFNRSGTVLATTSADSTIRLWNPTTGRLVITAYPGANHWQVVTPEGNVTYDPRGNLRWRHNLGVFHLDEFHARLVTLEMAMAPVRELISSGRP